jgi:general L-amino acid transport system substrate-binding protein
MPRPGEHIVLPELLTQEQTGPFVRQGDDPWLTVVRWTLLALIEAEQIGMTRATLSDFAASSDPRVRRFLDSDAALSEGLGLNPSWSQQIVAEVGNYGEIFERTLGDQSRLKLPRGANNLWDKGGLMIAPQFR